MIQISGMHLIERRKSFSCSLSVGVSIHRRMFAIWYPSDVVRHFQSALILFQLHPELCVCVSAEII